MLEPSAANPTIERWGPWQNLPCPDDPTSIAALCPHGWVELTVQQGTSPSTPDGGGEGYQDIRADRVWGLDVEVAKRICELIGDIQEGITNPISTIPHGVFGLLCRVFYDAGDADVGAPSYYGLEVGWGVDGKPIFNLPPPPLAISFLGVTVDGP